MEWTDLENKVVIITGGAAGIGLAVAKGFVEVGAKVMIADFSEDTGQSAAEEASNAGPGEARFSRCDVTNKGDVDQMVQSTLDAWGSIDVLVNNAGINVPRLLVDPAGKEELTEDVWDKVFAVNVKGQFLCAQSRQGSCSSRKMEECKLTCLPSRDLKEAKAKVFTLPPRQPIKTLPVHGPRNWALRESVLSE